MIQRRLTNLQHPEPQKRPKFVALIIKSIVFPRLQDSEEQEATQSRSPCDDEERHDKVARAASVLAECEREDG